MKPPRTIPSRVDPSSKINLHNCIAGVLGAMITPSELGGGFSIGTIIGLVYPVLTLYFLNLTFKDDLVS